MLATIDETVVRHVGGYLWTRPGSNLQGDLSTKKKRIGSEGDGILAFCARVDANRAGSARSCETKGIVRAPYDSFGLLGDARARAMRGVDVVDVVDVVANGDVVGHGVLDATPARTRHDASCGALLRTPRPDVTTLLPAGAKVSYIRPFLRGRALAPSNVTGERKDRGHW